MQNRVEKVVVVSAGSIASVLAWTNAMSGNDVVVLDSYPDGHMGKSFEQMVAEDGLDFSCLELKEITDALQQLPEEGELASVFKARFKGLPPVILNRLEQITHQYESQHEQLSQETCLAILKKIQHLDKSAIKLAQRSDEIPFEPDFIMVSVKGRALTKELGEKIARIKKNDQTRIVILVNGIVPWIKPEKPLQNTNRKIYEFIDALGSTPILVGILNKYGAERTPGKVMVNSPFSKTENIIAHHNINLIDDGLTEIAKRLTTAGIKTNVTTGYEKETFKKLAYNLCGSVMAAIFGCTFGELFDNQATKKAVGACAAEIYEIASSMNIALAASKNEFVEAMFKALADNRSVISSPLQDIWLGRPTEKEQLLAAPIELASEFGGSADFLKAMHYLISQVEAYACENVDKGKARQRIFLERLSNCDSLPKLTQQTETIMALASMSLISNVNKNSNTNGIPPTSICVTERKPTRQTI